MTAARRSLAKITKERDVLRCICDYLTVEGIPWFRMNAGEAEAPGDASRRIRLHPKGTADLLAIVPLCRLHMEPVDDTGLRHPRYHEAARPCFIEVKRPKGGKRSPEQVAFAEQMTAIGCLHIWAKDVEDVMAVIPPKIRGRG